MPSGMLKKFVLTKKEKKILLYIAFAVGLFALVTYLELIICFVGYIVDLFMPVIWQCNLLKRSLFIPRLLVAQ